MAFSTGLGWWLLSFTSLVEFSTVANGGLHDSYQKWGFAVGVISFVISAIMVLAMFIGKLEAIMSIDQFVSLFLTLMWAAGVGSNTSPNGPGHVVGNVYYASWLSLFASLYILYYTLARKYDFDMIEKMDATSHSAKEPENIDYL